MVAGTKTKTIIGTIFGAILIFYLIANVFNDASAEIDGINESYKGGKLMKLLGLFLAFGVVYSVYNMLAK